MSDDINIAVSQTAPKINMSVEDIQQMSVSVNTLPQMGITMTMGIGIDGKDAFVYIAYASDNTGTGFSLTPTDNLKYRAEIHTDTEIVSPQSSDFTGAVWVKYIGDDGTGGAGSGDMLTSTYDPNNKQADAFSMENMVESATNKIMTSDERTKLTGVDTGANKTVINNTLTSTSTTEALSAAQGKALKDEVTSHEADIAKSLEGVANVKSFGALGDGLTNDSAAFVDTVNSLGEKGGVVFIPPGTYIASDIPLKENVYYVGAGVEATELVAPDDSDASIFSSANTANFNGGGVKGVSLDGKNRVHGIDLSNIAKVEMFFIYDCYIANCINGYYGSLNDRTVQIKGNRFWYNVVGVYVIQNHPILEFNDIRYNETGIGGNPYHMLVMNCKIVRNEYGVRPLDGGNLEANRFMNTVFFRNTKGGLHLNARNNVQGCFFICEGQQADEYGIYVSGSNNRIAVSLFEREELGTKFGRGAIVFSPGFIDRTHITANTFRDCGDAILSDEVTNIRYSTFSNNQFNLDNGVPMYMGELTEFTNNSIHNNDIHFVGNSEGRSLFTILKSYFGYSFQSNVISASSDAMVEYALEGEANNSIIKNNRITRTEKINVTPNNATDISGNLGYKTEGFGTATIEMNDTSVVVEHGLDISPNRYRFTLTPITSLHNSKEFWISDVNDTTFTINRDVAGGDYSTFSWQYR